VGLNPIEKGRYDFGVELGAGAPADFVKGIIERTGTPVRLVVDHNVEGVGNRNDPCS